MKAGTVAEQVRDLAKAARESAGLLAAATSEQKNQALLETAGELRRREKEILAACAADMAEARAAGVPAAVVNRMGLEGRRFETMVSGVERVASLPDPVGEEVERWRHPRGMTLRKVRVPLGVIGLIYEARPNVTIDAGVLCVKTGNAVLLKGGKESERCNAVLTDVLREGLRRAGLPAGAAAAVPGGREGARALMEAVGLVDVLIPRGGAELIRAVVAQARVPVIETGAGVCHVYVHRAADPVMAERVVANAKLSNPAVCNAVETLLIDREAAAGILPRIAETLRERGVVLVGCEASRSLAAGIEPATEADWAEEYLDLKLSVRVVEGLEEALAHIRRYGTKHSEAIVTEDERAARSFLQAVDAACVYWNVSTRFTDGGEFGFGAEIGISTQKLHARGPMGLRELTSYKYEITGSGQVR